MLLKFIWYKLHMWTVPKMMCVGHALPTIGSVPMVLAGKVSIGEKAIYSVDVVVYMDSCLTTLWSYENLGTLSAEIPKPKLIIITHVAHSL